METQLKEKIDRKADDICKDHDEDCYTPNDDGTPHNALHCWLYAPECGICPLLQSKEDRRDE